MQIKKRATQGEFFKPAEFLDYSAFLVEVNRIEKDRPGKFGPKDAAHCTIHAFKTDEDVKAGNAKVQDYIINSAPLVKELNDPDLIGAATIVTLEETHFDKVGRDVPVWRSPSNDLYDAVVEYAEKYEAALEAEMDDAPGFDD